MINNCKKQNHKQNVYVPIILNALVVIYHKFINNFILKYF